MITFADKRKAARNFIVSLDLAGLLNNLYKIDQHNEYTYSLPSSSLEFL